MDDLITLYGVAPGGAGVVGSAVVPCASREIAEGIVNLLRLRGFDVRAVQRSYKQRPVTEWAEVKGARNG